MIHSGDHHLRSWTLALSRLTGITQRSQFQSLKSPVTTAASISITNQGAFHATNLSGKTSVPPYLLGKNLEAQATHKHGRVSSPWVGG